MKENPDLAPDRRRQEILYAEMDEWPDNVLAAYKAFWAEYEAMRALLPFEYRRYDNKYRMFGGPWVSDYMVGKGDARFLLSTLVPKAVSVGVSEDELRAFSAAFYSWHETHQRADAALNEVAAPLLRVVRPLDAEKKRVATAGSHFPSPRLDEDKSIPDEDLF